MKPSLAFSGIFALLFFLVSPPVESSGWTRSGANVPLEDSVYRDIDQLVGLGLAPDVIYGHRPWSRTEIARIVKNAEAKFKETPPPVAPSDFFLSLDTETESLLDRLKKRFADELDEKTVVFHPLASARAEYDFVDQESRPIPDNGLGTVDASIAPLTAYREGRHYPDGHQFAVETEHYAALTRFFSFYARPRFQMEIRDGGDVQAHAFVQQLYGKFTVPHLEIEVGRDSLAWGQGVSGGILLSNNARPLDLIKLSNPSPTILPWVFKYLGALRYSFFIANLGPEREFSRPFLTGGKFTIKPFSFFELGISQLMLLGGKGAPGPLSFGSVVGEFFGKRAGNVYDVNITNRETGFDFRLYLPFMRNSQFYIDAQLEDNSKDRSFLFRELMNYQIGLFIPRLDNSGLMTLRLEYGHGSPFFYRHSLFTDGMTLNRRILGDQMGPQSNGIRAEWTYRLSDKFWTSSSFHYERYGGNVLNQTTDPDGSNRRLTVTASRPSEHRVRIQWQGEYQLRPRCRLDAGLAYERARNFNFLLKEDRNGFLVQTAVHFALF